MNFTHLNNLIHRRSNKVKALSAFMNNSIVASISGGAKLKISTSIDSFSR